MDYAMQCEQFYQNQADLDDQLQEEVQKQIGYIEEDVIDFASDHDNNDILDAIESRLSTIMLYVKWARKRNNFEELGRKIAEIISEPIKEEAKANAEVIVYG